MTTTVAKPIRSDFWILKKGQVKVGELHGGPWKFVVVMNGVRSESKTLQEVVAKLDLVFEDPTDETSACKEINGFPTSGPVFNPGFDVKKGYAVFTKEQTSKAFFAAGWFIVTRGANRRKMFCPKVLVLQRYPFEGPFKEEPHD